MLNEKKIEEIRNKIQTSALLTDHEKSDWLNLLELMNDKQLSELEEILSGAAGTPLTPQAPQQQSPATRSKSLTPVSTPPTSVKPSMPPLTKMPPLTHIANIPTDISSSQVPVTARPPVSSQASPLNQAKPPVPPASSIPTRPTAPAETVTKHPTQPETTAVPQRPSGITLPRYKAEKMEDIQAFSLETIRTYDLQSVVDAVRDQIQQHGYFKIVQYLELSPLYDSYINSGKERLRSTSGEQVSNNSLLTQEELEFMTDLLRHMRFNRW